MNLDSIQSHLTIAEDVDCKGGAVGLTLQFRTNELEVKLEISYRLRGDYELKYYRNHQMMKQILNGKLIVDDIPNEELVSRMTLDADNSISNLSIISLDFLDFDKKLISSSNEEKINRLIIDKQMKIPEFTAQNQEKPTEVLVTNSEVDDEDEEEEEQHKKTGKKEDKSKLAKQYLAMETPEEEEKKPEVKEETTHLENVGQNGNQYYWKGFRNV